jgi:hypothetical protein
MVSSSVNNSSKFVENFASHVSNGVLVFTYVVFVEDGRLVKMLIHCKFIVIFLMLHYNVLVPNMKLSYGNSDGS